MDTARGDDTATVLSSRDLAGWVRQLPNIDTNAADPELIDQITQLERIKSACAAAQAQLTDTFITSQTAGLTAKARDERTRRSITSQIGIARHDSPRRGNQHVGLAKALLHEMPNVYKALQTGDISEWRATLIVRETACLSKENRQQVDKELAPQLPGLGDKHIAQAAATIGQRLDPGHYVARARKATHDRRVTVRPAPDTMAYVTALLPVAWGVAVYAALTRHATTSKATGDPRTPGQLMADEFVRRITTPDTTTNNDTRWATTTPTTPPAPPTSSRPTPTNTEQPAPAKPETTAGCGTPAENNRSGYSGEPAPSRPSTKPAQAMINNTVHVDDSDNAPDDLVVSDSDSLDDSDSDLNHLDEDDTDLDDTDIDDPDLDDTDPDEIEVAGSDLDNTDPDEAAAERSHAASPDPGATEPATGEAGAVADPPEPAAIPPGVGININLIMTDRTLFDGDNEPAILTDYGPIPAPLARRLIRDATPQIKTWIRRLYTDPDTGHLIAADPRRRTFTHAARQFLITRDQYCRTPFCGAPIRHADHITSHNTGGPTQTTNGQGLCEQCNYTKEQPGWTSHTDPDGNGITITTPTGHTTRSEPPRPPRSNPWTVESPTDNKPVTSPIIELGPGWGQARKPTSRVEIALRSLLRAA